MTSRFAMMVDAFHVLGDKFTDPSEYRIETLEPVQLSSVETPVDRKSAAAWGCVG